MYCKIKLSIKFVFSVIKVVLLCERSCSYVARASLKLTVHSQSRMKDRAQTTRSSSVINRF